MFHNFRSFKMKALLTLCILFLFATSLNLRAANFYTDLPTKGIDPKTGTYQLQGHLSSNMPISKIQGRLVLPKGLELIDIYLVNDSNSLEFSIVNKQEYNFKIQAKDCYKPGSKKILTFIIKPKDLYALPDIVSLQLYDIKLIDDHGNIVNQITNYLCVTTNRRLFDLTGDNKICLLDLFVANKLIANKTATDGQIYYFDPNNDRLLNIEDIEIFLNQCKGVKWSKHEVNSNNNFQINRAYVVMISGKNLQLDYGASWFNIKDISNEYIALSADNSVSDMLRLSPDSHVDKIIIILDQSPLQEKFKILLDTEDMIVMSDQTEMEVSLIGKNYESIYKLSCEFNLPDNINLIQAKANAGQLDINHNQLELTTDLYPYNHYRDIIKLKFKLNNVKSGQIIRMDNIKINGQDLASTELILEVESTSGIIVRAKPNPIKLTSYPNPCQDYTTFQYNGIKGKIVLSLYNLLGIKVADIANQHTDGALNVKFNTNHLAPGIYLVVISVNNYLKTGHKIIVK
ncbi:MAG: T9SS type A sorting domain-containing protein [bacterium]